MNDSSPIGVFDSGVGGLSVLKKLVSALPYENYVYFGDTARVPYGEKSKQELIDFAKEILDWYQGLGVKAVLMACNTSSAVTLDVLKDYYDFPVLGLINPTAKHIASLDAKKVGIIATSATVNSKAYSNAIKNKNKDIDVLQVACPGLVEIVESGKVHSSESRKIIASYLEPLVENNVEKIVLGCTHYPFLKDVIESILGKQNMLVDPADALVKAAVEELKDSGSVSTNHGQRKYYVSSNADKFLEVGKNFYSDCSFVEKIDIQSLLAQRSN